MLFVVNGGLKGEKHDIGILGKGGGGVTLGEGIAMSTVEKGNILQKCLNTLSLIVACEDRRHFATLPDWFPSEKTSKERP